LESERGQETGSSTSSPIRRRRSRGGGGGRACRTLLRQQRLGVSRSSPPLNPRTMSQVEVAFQEYQDRREGLIKALSKGLETLIKEAKKINKHTPYKERKCLWGLQNKGWELKLPIYPTFEEPPHPQPLPEFDEAVTTLTEWMSLVSDYSDAWLAGFSAYNSLSFSQHERVLGCHFLQLRSDN
ncbi:unnamed protein product, partial [Urochloa humidicola]